MHFSCCQLQLALMDWEVCSIFSTFLDLLSCFVQYNAIKLHTSIAFIVFIVRNFSDQFLYITPIRAVESYPLSIECGANLFNRNVMWLYLSKNTRTHQGKIISHNLFTTMNLLSHKMLGILIVDMCDSKVVTASLLLYSFYSGIKWKHSEEYSSLQSTEKWTAFGLCLHNFY